MDERTRSDGKAAAKGAVDTDAPAPLAQRVADAIRAKLIAGELKPGQRMPEAALTSSFAVSRNTLREVFRLLTTEGLLRHEPNRGVFVSTPSMGSIIDIYRVRRVIECQAIAKAYAKHPAVDGMRRAVDAALACREAADWRGVGSANMLFHAAVVELADSPRLNGFYAQVAAELRLCFGLFSDPEFLHDPYIDLNASILLKLEAGRRAKRLGCSTIISCSPSGRSSPPSGAWPEARPDAHSDLRLTLRTTGPDHDSDRSMEQTPLIDGSEA